MRKSFIIVGTHCAGCKGLLEEVIMDIPGVKSVTVDAQSGQTELEYEEAMDWASLKNKVAAAGHYQVQE